MARGKNQPTRPLTEEQIARRQPVLVAVPMVRMLQWQQYMQTHPEELRWVTNVGLYGFVTLNWTTLQPRMDILEAFIQTAEAAEGVIRGMIGGHTIRITEQIITEVLQLPSGPLDTADLNPDDDIYNFIVGSTE